MKIYTRTGDEGETGLFGGGRVPKDHPRVSAYGDVDELNAALGVARAAAPGGAHDALLEQVQRDLFSIGGYFPPGPVKFGTPEWYDLLNHTVTEAERLGLIFGVHNCDGWSESGGPWVTPEMSMQRLVSTETLVTGGARVTVALPVATP